MEMLYRLPDELLDIIFEMSHNMVFRDVILQMRRIIKYKIMQLPSFPFAPYAPSVISSVLVFRNNDMTKSAVGWRYVHNRRNNDLYSHEITILGTRTTDSFSHAVGRYPARFSFVNMKYYDKAKLHELCKDNGLPHRKSYTRDKLITYLLKQPDN